VAEKSRKPAKEALAAVVDGLDVLLGIGKEEKKEEKEERKGEAAPPSPDTFSGLLQSFIPFFILPQLLPLFQQALTQTLSSTTVNVRVESATSIIPIDISATTAIVPIEIRASQVTLNVNITGSQVTLNVNIASSTATLNVNIVGQAMTINTNIEAQTVDLRIFTASGRWVSASDLVSTAVVVRYRTLPPAVETTLVDVVGRRGRLKYLGIWFFDNNTNSSVYNIRLRIYVDGSLRAELTLETLDLLTGFSATQLWKALDHHLRTALPLPFNTARLSSSPDPEKYLIMPFFSGPRGGVTYIVWNRTSGNAAEAAAYLETEFEFTNSLSIRMYNDHPTSTLVGGAIALIGEYL